MDRMREGRRLFWESLAWCLISFGGIAGSIAINSMVLGIVFGFLAGVYAMAALVIHWMRAA